jgi:PDZ domain-containing protein
MLDTTTPTVPGGGSGDPDGTGSDADAGADGRRPHRPSARTWWILGGLAAFGLVVGLAVNLIELDKVTIGPGGARPVEELVSVGDGGEAFPAEGDILFTTVSLDDRVTVWDGLLAWLDDDVAVFDKSEILGDRDPEESQQFNQELMEDSKTTAVRVALERLGYDVASGTGASVAIVDPDQPAADVLEAEETVVALDGEPLELGDDLVAAVRAREPGDPVTITIEDGAGEAREETVELGERPDLPGEAYMGIGVGTRDMEFDLPFEIDIDSGEVGGPSAGLAFTLAVLDVLTPGELTGGAEIATTGTINGLGEVGPVGGVAQKAAAVCDVGVALFLVPEPEMAEAEAAACDDLEVVGVADLDEALEALAAAGGDSTALDPLVS